MVKKFPHIFLASLYVFFLKDISSTHFFSNVIPFHTKYFVLPSFIDVVSTLSNLQLPCCALYHIIIGYAIMRPNCALTHWPLGNLKCNFRYLILQIISVIDG